MPRVPVAGASSVNLQAAGEAGGAGDPIPFRRPVEQQEELHVADPAPAPLDDLAAPQPAPSVEPEPVIGPTGRPMPVLPEPRPISIHGNARVISMCNQKG